jgi:uncharacterized membrane protein
MKKIIAGFALAGLAVVVGCNTSPTGGGTDSGTSFKLSGPVTATTVKHGTSETVKVSITRGKEFKEDVNFTADVIDPASKDKSLKVRVEPSHWKASDPTEVKITATAEDKTAAGDYVVRLNAKPAKGEPTSVDIKFKVTEKK